VPPIVGISKTAYVLATPRCLGWRRDQQRTSTNDDPLDSQAPRHRPARPHRGERGSPRLPAAGVLILDSRIAQWRPASWAPCCARRRAAQHTHRRRCRRHRPPARTARVGRVHRRRRAIDRTTGAPGTAAAVGEQHRRGSGALGRRLGGPLCGRDECYCTVAGHEPHSLHRPERLRRRHCVDGQPTTITGVVLGQPGQDQIAAGLAAAAAMVDRIASQ